MKDIHNYERLYKKSFSNFELLDVSFKVEFFNDSGWYGDNLLENNPMCVSHVTQASPSKPPVTNIRAP
jgi:hypothetical protein